MQIKTELSKQGLSESELGEQAMNSEELWQNIVSESKKFADESPELNDWFKKTILDHDSFNQALAHQLACLLGCEVLGNEKLNERFLEILKIKPSILEASIKDLLACYARDPACEYYAMPLLYFKGYQALQAQRLANYAWHHEQKSLAYYLQNQMSCKFGVDMHPAVKLGHGIMLDHATSVVMGETSVVGNNVSILHGVTLGGCGISEGVRHPKIGDGALISAGAKILGAVHVGAGAKIAAGTLVLEDVPAHSTVAGVPARIVGKPKSNLPAEDMDQSIE